MKRDPKRKPGFYWIRFEGKAIVAEWQPILWYVGGSVTGFKDSEVCELLSSRLRAPKEKP